MQRVDHLGRVGSHPYKREIARVMLSGIDPVDDGPTTSVMQGRAYETRTSVIREVSSECDNVLCVV